MKNAGAGAGSGSVKPPAFSPGLPTVFNISRFFAAQSALLYFKYFSGKLLTNHSICNTMYYRGRRQNHDDLFKAKR